MNYRLVLNNSKELILNGIRGDIYSQFKSRNYITEDEFDVLNNMQHSIVNRKAIREKNEAFFGILLRIIDQKPDVYDEFLEMLEENYDWISRSIRQEAVLTGGRNFNEEKHPTDDDKKLELENKAEEALRSGGTPLLRLSSLYVTRAEMEEKLKREIISLKPGMFLVLQGMAGTGKSSLAMNVLKDHDIISKYLEGKVFWLYEQKTIEQILHKLFGLISDDPVPQGEIEPINLQNQIAYLIKNKKLEQALIVFDDVVSSNEFIQYLNFNCKKLIISQSHSDSIVAAVPSKLVKTLKIDYALNQNEGLSLLAKASDMDITELPVEAKEIIHLTRGFPFLVHFIAKQMLGNKALKNGLWKSTTEVLRRKRRGNEHAISQENLIDSILKEELYNVFDSYWKELTAEMQGYYEMFAVFHNDINLKTEVFATIWSMNELSVIKVLDDLENKSLIGRRPNPRIGGYVYGIHDVLLYYLRNKKKDDMKKLHNVLVEKYYAKCGGEFWKLNDDNYIYFYLGYHLEGAQRLDLFNLFVNLKFISAKVKAVGATDLLNDYKKYEKYIATEDNVELFEELKEFVKHYGHILYQSDDIDIIQLGLQQEKSSAIFQSARALAVEEKLFDEKIFLDFQPRHKFSNNGSDSLSYRISKEVTVACFSDNFNYAFLANSDGSIHKKTLNGVRSTTNYFPSESESGVAVLTLSPDKRYLLSVSQDLKFRIWDLQEVGETEAVIVRRYFNENATLKNGDHSPSPPLRQEAHSPIFPSSHLKATMIADGAKHHSRPLTCLKFSPDSKSILSCSDDRSVNMWAIEVGGVNRVALQQSWEKDTASVPRCCAFSSNGRTALVGCDNGALHAWSVEYGFSDKKFQFESAIKCLHTVRGVNGAHPAIEGHSDFVLVLSKRVVVKRINNSYLQSARVNNSNEHSEVLCSWSYQTSQESFITRSWVQEYGAFIALTTSPRCVSLYNLANGHLQREYVFEIGQEVRGIDFFMGREPHETSYMLVLCEGDILRREKLELSPNDQAAKFCVSPNWGGALEPTVVMPCMSGCKIFEGENNRWLNLKTNVTSCHIDKNGHLVVIGTDCGSILTYNLDTYQTATVLAFKDSHNNPSLVVLVRIFVIGNENLIVAVDNQHLMKISYKSNVIEYQATSKVKGVWYCCGTNELILVERNQQIKVLNVTSGMGTFYDLLLADANGNVDPVEESSDIICCCDFSSTNYLALSRSKAVDMVNLVNRNGQTMSVSKSINCCVFSADGLFIAFGFNDGTIQVYNVQLQLLRETCVRRSVKWLCLGNGGCAFGALTAQRIHLGRWMQQLDKKTPSGFHKANSSCLVGCTQLDAKQLMKAPGHDCFLTIDKHSQLYKVTFFDKDQGESERLEPNEPLFLLDLNSRPKKKAVRKLRSGKDKDML